MATLPYDTIDLKLNSTATLTGIQNAIDLMKQLGELSNTDLNGLKQTADAVNEFTKSLKGVNSAVLREYRELADALSKIARHGNSAKRAMDKMGASIKQAGEQASQPIVDPENIDNAEHMSTALIPVVTALKNVGDASKTATDDVKKLRSAFEALYKLGSGKPSGLLGDGQNYERPQVQDDSKILEANYWEVTQFEDALTGIEEHASSIKRLTSSIDIFSDEDKKKIDAISQALDALSNHIVRDRKIAEHQGDTEFGAMVERYASDIKGISKIVADAMSGDIVQYKNSLDDILEVVRKITLEYGSITRSQGTAFGGEDSTVESITLSLEDLNKVLEEISDKGGLRNALNANGAEDLAGILDGIEARANDTAEKLQKLRDILIDNPNVSDKFLMSKRGGGFDIELIRRARQELEDSKRVVEEFTGELEDCNKVLRAIPYNAEMAGEAVRPVTGSIKGLASEAKKAKSPLEVLISRFKSLMVYRVLRNIITGIGNAIKEGFTNLEQWDRKEGHTGFAESMDRARESLTVLKNSLAVVGAPFLEFLINILEKIARLVMTVTNWTSRMIAILTGKSSYRTVEWAEYSAKATDDYGHSVSGATKKVKEFQRQLMGFDEINNLTGQNDNGTGGGGGGGAGGGGYNFKDMFGEETVGELTGWEKKLADFGEKVRKFFKNLSEWWGEFKTNLDEYEPPMWLQFFTLTFKRKPKEDALNIPKRKAGRQVENRDYMFKTLAGKARAYGKILDNLITKEERLGQLKTGFDELGDSADEFGKRGKNALNEFEEETGKATDTLKNKLNATIERSGVAIDNAVGKKSESAFSKFNTSITKTSTALKNNIIDPLGKVSTSIENAFGKKIGVEFSKSLKGGKQDLDNLTSGVDTFKAKMEQSFGKTWHMKVQGKLELEAIDIFKDYDMIGHLEHKADGGFVNKGQLFIAREAGAEMVGQIGGHTAVANNQDIVNAVASGVASAVASVMNGANTNVEVVLEGDARGLFRVVQQQAKNYAVQTGKYAFG